MSHEALPIINTLNILLKKQTQAQSLHCTHKSSPQQQQQQQQQQQCYLLKRNSNVKIHLNDLTNSRSLKHIQQVQSLMNSQTKQHSPYKSPYKSLDKSPYIMNSQILYMSPQHQQETSQSKIKFNRSDMLKEYISLKQKILKKTAIDLSQDTSSTLKPGRFHQAISEHLNKPSKYRIYSPEKSFKEIEKPVEKPPSPIIPQSPKQVVYQYRHKFLDTSESELKKEQNRDEIIKQIQYGQKQLASFQNFMQNKASRSLIKETKSHKNKTDFKTLRSQLVNQLHYLKRLQLTPKMILKYPVFSYKPFQKQNSYELISACKIGDLLGVEELLQMNRFIIYDFDYIHLTALHWACKRNHSKIVTFLLQKGADSDAQDLIGRTPLYFAIEANNIQNVKILLQHWASPWSTPTAQYNQICEDKRPIMKLLNKARKMHILLRMTPPHQREGLWHSQMIQGLRI